MRHVAVMDFGSNSFRLVAYGYEEARVWMRTDEIREPVRISEGMGDEAVLRPEPVARAVSTAAVFAAFCESAEIHDVIPVATSAIRDAANQAEVLAEIKRGSGLDVRVISAHDEAWYGYLAVANSMTLVNGFAIDIGGGSVQVMRLAGRKLASWGSWPIGAVRMSERFLPGEDATAKGMKALRKHVAKQLEGADWLTSEDAQRLAGMGGTIRNLAAAAQKMADHPSTGVQGFRLSRDALEELIEELASRPASKRARVPGIKPDRGDVILGGALVLAAAMNHAGLAAVEVTEAGLREGVFFERYLDGADPPLFEDVRHDSVLNLAHRYLETLDHSRHVAELSLEIYDGLAQVGLHQPSELDRELLWAAGILHDVGVAVDYDDHHKHSHYLVMNAGLPGFTPRELVLIALIARYHRKGDPDASELGPLARKGDQQRLDLLAGVIRLAEQLERSRNQVVRAVHLEAADGRVLLAAEAANAPDANVSIWAAQRNADLLARALDRELEIHAR